MVDKFGEERAPTPAVPQTLLEAWRVALGDAQVCADASICTRYARTLSPTGTHPIAVLYPRTRDEVVAVVRAASAHGVALHPVATGRNWGYGDACAPDSGMAILDLSRMNQIVELNRTLGYAVIEPGVTQGQLYETLQREAPEFWLDCTGAGPDASIVGNALQRGFGHTPYADHARTQCGLEVVLADGRILETGFGHLPGARARHVFPYGLGPYIDGLFTQSNLGVITKMTLWLQPRPEDFRFFWIRVDNSAKLNDLVEALRPLRMSGQLRSALHIGNDLRVISAGRGFPWERGETPPLSDSLRGELRKALGCGAWNASGSLTGTHAEVRAASKALSHAVRGIGRVVYLDDTRVEVLKSARALARRLGLASRLCDAVDRLEENYALLQGCPTRGPLRGMLWRLRQQPAGEVHNLSDTSAGLCWLAPVLPFTGEDAVRVQKILTPLLAEHGFDLMVTFTALNERSMVCIVNLSFDHAQKCEAEAARACQLAAQAALAKQGYYPYRASSLGHPVMPEDTFGEVTRAIKQALDPTGILSPGLYISRP